MMNGDRVERAEKLCREAAEILGCEILGQEDSVRIGVLMRMLLAEFDNERAKTERIVQPDEERSPDASAS